MSPGQETVPAMDSKGPRAIMRVVIFKLNNLGDNVVFVPAVQALRAHRPDWQITLLTTAPESAFYKGHLGPQRIMVCPKQRFNGAYRRPWEIAAWIWRIRRIKPDACLVAFDQSNVAHLVAKFSGAGIRIGGNLGRIRVSRSITEEVPIPEDLRPVTWNWRMARALARPGEGAVGWPDSPPPPDLRHLLTAPVSPAGSRKRVVVHPGAGGGLNQWPRERFAAVAAALSRDHEVIWIDHGRTTGPAPAGATGAAVGSIEELAGWLASADLFLGNNSGPMHLANALGRPGVAVTGPTSTGWDPYWKPSQWSVLRHPALACQPCEKTTVALEACANTASPMACLKYWTEDRVEAVCRSRLGLATAVPT
jgi:ADP-heptose:LPS heptosyltransferase